MHPVHSLNHGQYSQAFVDLFITFNKKGEQNLFLISPLSFISFSSTFFISFEEFLHHKLFSNFEGISQKYIYFSEKTHFLFLFYSFVVNLGI